MDKICLHGLVKGRVQGVWFRRFAQKKASMLGVTGWVKNTMDGQVEILICGNREALFLMQAYLKKGPPLAKVTALDLQEVALKMHDSFQILN